MSVDSVRARLGSFSQAYQLDSPDDYNTCTYTEHAVLSIEEIRLQMYSCFTCGVSWLQDHVCLDCYECGGYSLERPCTLCDGQCASTWKRDLTMSHACGKARWNGVCYLQSSDSVKKPHCKEEELQHGNHLNKSTQRS